MKIDCVANVEHRHKGFWFTPDTIRFWKSKTYNPVYETDDGCQAYFVSSERYGHASRTYTVRVQDIITGDISTVASFSTKAKADKEAQRLAQRIN